MHSRFIALIAVVSLLAGVVQLPLPGVAVTVAAQATEHSHHHCCPKPAPTQAAAVMPLVPSLPCGPNHSCCAVRAPAKLPSLPAGASDKSNRQLAQVTTFTSPTPRQPIALPSITSTPIGSALQLTTALRI